MNRSCNIVLIVTFLLIPGCAPVMVAPPSGSTPMKGMDGTVVLSVTGNTGQVDQFDTIQIKQHVLAEPGTAPIVGQYVLRQVSQGMARDTALFMGVVPQGDYVLDKLSDERTKKYLQLNARTVERIGIFRVKAGAVSDLGRIIVTPVNTRVLVGRSQRVRSNRDLVRRFVPQSAEVYAAEVSEGWVREREADDLVEEYALQRPAGADGLAELSNGWVVGASRLGSIMVRLPMGHWRAVRGDQLESLLWVKPYETESTLLLAVGEFNTILRMNRQGKVERIDSGDLPPGNLLFLDGSDKVGWFVALQHGTDVTIFHSATLENGAWTALRTENVAASFWDGPNSFWAWSKPGGFGYAISSGKIALFDFEAGRWIERTSPKQARLIQVSAQPADTLAVLTSPGGGFAGVFATAYLSRDAGATWNEISSPFKVKVAPPYLTPGGTLLMSGGVFGKPELRESRDMGKTWRRISDLHSLEETIVVTPTKGLFAVSSGAATGIATIRHSEDGGLNWRTEYSNFDRAAYDAEQEKKK